MEANNENTLCYIIHEGNEPKWSGRTLQSGGVREDFATQVIEAGLPGGEWRGEGISGGGNGKSEDIEVERAPHINEKR